MDQTPARGQKKQLALPLRESRPSFLDLLVITIRQFFNERRDVNAARCFNHFLFTDARVPRVMFAAISPEKRKTSCNTKPTWRRKCCLSQSRMSMPSTRIAPR